MITKKERNLLKAAFRRVFSKSELRNKVLKKASITHYDATRPRVKNWSKCQACRRPTPTYLMVVDHIDPVIPLSLSFEYLSLDDLCTRIWCKEENLQAICKGCHADKTSLENKMRRVHKSKKKTSQTKKKK